MIVSRIKAGLGNQLFQYSAGYCLARDCDLPFGMDLSWFSLKTLPKNIAKRSFGLPLPFEHTDPGDLTKVCEKNGFKHQDLPREPCCLLGHWETEKYFKHRREEIQALFGPPRGFQCQEFDLSIHIRGTDFLKLSCRRGLGTEKYYLDSFEAAKKELGHECSVAVFTDDPEYARKILGLDVEIQERGKRDIEDIWRMSRCRNHIIANSSFSWWGAWLNHRGEKIVYYPPMLYKGYPPTEKTDWPCESWKRSANQT